MRKFIFKLVLFFLFVLIFSLFFQILISTNIKEKNLYGLDNLGQTSNINADLVFLGSSRCWSHFDPMFFDSCFHLKSVNIGVDGHTELTMAIVRLKDYLSRNIPPKYCILSFDPMVRGGSEVNNTNFVCKNKFARYAFFPDNKDLLIVNYFQFNFLEKYCPLYAVFKYQILPECIAYENKSNWMKYGYEMHNISWDTVAYPIPEEAKKYYFKEKDVPEIIINLNSLSNLCKQYNIKLICIQTPVYQKIYKKTPFKVTRELCNLVHIQFIDANYESIRSNINCFYNVNHMNKTGIDSMNIKLKGVSELRSFFNQRIP